MDVYLSKKIESIQKFNKCRKIVQDYHKENFPHLQKIGIKVGRNEPCICGSGKKFKKCCLNKELI